MRRLPQGLGFEPAGGIILEGSGIFQKWGVVGGSGHWQSGALRGIPAAKLPPCDLLPAHEVGPPPPPHRRHHGQNLEALFPLSDCWVFCHSDKNEEYPPSPPPPRTASLSQEWAHEGGWGVAYPQIHDQHIRACLLLGPNTTANRDTPREAVQVKPHGSRPPWDNSG